MSTLTESQMQILLSAASSLTRRALGLSGDELRSAIRPVWAQTLTDILHDQEECFCHRGGRCLTDVSDDEQDRLLASDHELSLESFVSMYEDACHQAIDDTQIEKSA